MRHCNNNQQQAFFKHSPTYTLFFFIFTPSKVTSLHQLNITLVPTMSKRKGKQRILLSSFLSPTAFYFISLTSFSVFLSFQGLSADDKRRVILKIYHEKKEPFNLKVFHHTCHPSIALSDIFSCLCSSLYVPYIARYRKWNL